MSTAFACFTVIQNEIPTPVLVRLADITLVSPQIRLMNARPQATVDLARGSVLTISGVGILEVEESIESVLAALGQDWLAKPFRATMEVTKSAILTLNNPDSRSNTTC